MNNLILSTIFCLIFAFSACTAAQETLTKTDSPQNSAGANTDSRPSAAANIAETKGQTSGVTGTYEYKGDGRSNEFKILELDSGEIKVAFAGTYEFKSAAGYLNANSGEISPQTVKMEEGQAVLTPTDAPECRLTLTFKSGGLKVVQNENDCGFPGGVTADGSYRKTSGKAPAFDEEPAKTPEAALENEPGQTPGPAAKRVRFPAGADTAALSGKISDSTAVSYIIGARAGQTLDVEVIDGGENNDVVVTVTDKKGARLKSNDSYGERWTGRLPRTGDYIVTVNTIETKDTNFKIRLTIR